MATYNEIQIARYNRCLQKLLGIKGGPPARSLAGDVQATLSLEEFGVENRYLISWNRFGMFSNIAASAGNTSCIRWRNPVGSNVVAVLEKYDYFSLTSTDQPIVSIGTSSADLGTTVAPTGAGFDSRGLVTPTLILSQQNTAAAAPALTRDLFQVQLTTTSNAAMIGTRNQEIPILPGSAIQVRSNAVNLPLALSMFWRERFLEDSERT